LFLTRKIRLTNKYFDVIINNILGVTGPLMVFDEALYKFSKNSEVEFLVWRTWISFWVIIIALTIACFQGSFVVKFFTSFTKDIFAMFIASIYIAEALENTIHVSKTNHLLSCEEKKEINRIEI